MAMKISYTGYLLRYAFYVVVVSLALFAVFWLLYRFVPAAAVWLDGGGGSGANAVGAILPAMYLAQKFYQSEQRPMRRVEGWLIALGCVMILIGLALVFIAVLIRFDPQLATDLDVLRGNMGVVAGIGAFVSFLYLLATRLIFWVTIRGQIKRTDRLAKR